jgi:cyclopropane fatty-acyl-phospholipid synthase-like methyltransferase
MVSVWDADHWRAFFTAVAKSDTRRRIRREVYGPEYPEEVDPSSFITWTELRRIAHELRVGPGQALVDLGCGLGGPGLWLAAETGADLTGVDLIPVALDQARQRADSMGIGARARFQAGDFEATGLPADSFDAAVSVDVVSFVQHKPAAFHEVARILRPGSYFGFTTWESDRASLAGVVAPQVADYRPLLRDAGFVVETYEEPPGWRERQSDVYQRTLSARSNLIEEMGEMAASRLLDEASARLPDLAGTNWRRVLAIARKS